MPALHFVSPTNLSYNCPLLDLFVRKLFEFLLFASVLCFVCILNIPVAID